MNSTDSGLLARNLDNLARRFPELHEAVIALPEPRSVLVGSLAEGTLNLDLGHTLLYSGDAQSYAEAQLTKFRATPERVYMEPPVDFWPPYQQQHHVSHGLYERYGSLELTAFPDTPSLDDGGYMLVYGIGLGLHLPALFAEAPVRHFILIEEHLEFFRHSLSLIDWAEIIERMISAGQTLHFVVGTDPGVISGRVHWHIRGRGFGLVDGSYVFRHYSSTVIDQAHRDFVKNLPLLAISIGFFEDEMVMMQNATENLVRRSFLFFEPKPRLEKDIPAFIVGSGPSLDATIEHLKRLSGQAVIFSSGTALLPLLLNGIRPDFHCELENGYGSVEVLQRTAAQCSLEGVTLLASTTVHPAMLDLFPDRVLYFRDSVVSTPLWCPDGLGIHGTAPTCTNLALRGALLLGFREIYFFGVDLGTRTRQAHHAKDSIYRDDAKLSEEMVTDPVRVMNIEMPGNFGGIAYTNQILHWARMMMVQAIEGFGVARIFNCCDGVNVPGALPKLARTIRLTVPPGRKDIILRRLRLELDPKQPVEMAPLAKLQEVRQAFRAYYSAMRAEIAAALDAKSSFIAFYDAMQPFLTQYGASPYQSVLRAMNIGLVMMCFQIGYFFYRRVEETERQTLMRIFLGLMSERLTEMDEQVDALFGRLEQLYTAT